MRLDSIFQDVRYAVRTIGRAPLFAATVAATMGLALGLVGSAFTLLNAYLIRPVNLPNPRALYVLSWDTETTYYERFGLADYEALEPEARRLASVAATLDASVMQDAVSTRGLLVTGNYFEMLGARPAVGRLLRRDDAAARGARPVVVLSHELWRSRCGPGPHAGTAAACRGSSSPRWVRRIFRSGWTSRRRFRRSCAWRVSACWLPRSPAACPRGTQAFRLDRIDGMLWFGSRQIASATLHPLALLYVASGSAMISTIRILKP